jgi:acyl-coenzyme A synthetase/AMP-(fatty) acid ligase
MTGNGLPLTAHAGPDDIVAWRPDGAVSQARFLADVTRLAAMLPAGGSMLNVCEDRYRFMVGLAAALVAGKVSLLPASQAAETVRQLKESHADLFCLHDGKSAGIALPLLRYPELPVSEIRVDVPVVDAGRVAVILFTSGSTGTPVAQAKTWGALVRNGRAEAERLGFLDAAGHNIVGTVPAQHSYGFESTVLLSLQGNCAAWAGRPFYPADIAAALAAVPRPRLLVTTPFHLRALLDSGIEVPPLDMILSATAPLSAALAREAEVRLGGTLNEIYGCTESGQLASRRTAASAAWLPFPGIRLDQEDGVTFVSGGHVEGGRQRLGDIIELSEGGSFLLHGRSADMVNIAGKRTSLGYLNHQLGAIAGVDDGCFFMPDEADDGGGEGITRLAAFVVAPTLTPKQLLEALRVRLDPIFLPRPLVLLDRLPRNATGKLPRDELQALLDRHREGAQ